MSLQQTSHQSFESCLDAYSGSATNAVKKSKNLGNATGFFAGAAAVLAMGSTEAEAATTVVDVNHVLNPASDTLASYTLNIAGFGHATSDFQFEAVLDEVSFGNRDWFRMGGTTMASVAGSEFSTAFNYVSRFSLGQLVSGALNFVDGDNTTDSYLASSGHPNPIYPANGEWLGGGQGYVGFRIDADGVAGGDVHYGWIEVRVDADNGGGEIIRYGIETDANTAVAIPEPNSLACLAIGAVGLLGWRQRRKDAA
jgi:hypothetical protein